MCFNFFNDFSSTICLQVDFRQPFCFESNSYCSEQSEQYLLPQSYC
jgi:hypothetical protein